MQSPLQAVLRRVDLVDGSTFTVVPPRLRGVLPRLAQRLVVERMAACVCSHGGDEGLVASLEAHGALAEGFSGEAGSFIRRRVWVGLVGFGLAASEAGMSEGPVGRCTLRQDSLQVYLLPV